SLAALSVDGATLSPAFSPDNMAYTVYVPAGTSQITIQATAANKQNNVVYRVGETEYRRTAAVPVENGTDVSVISGGQTEYMLTVSSEEAPWNVVIPTGDGFTVTGASTVAKGADYTFTVAVDEGWDASEMAVTVNGETLTPDETGVYTVPAVQSDLTIAVSGLIPPPAGPEVTFQGHTAQVAYIQVYTYDNGQVGTTDLLAGVERSVNSSNVVTYTTDLPLGDYWVKGYDDRDQYSGGILVTVTENGENVFNFQRAYSIYASNSGWVQGTDYTVDVSIQGADMSERVIELGSVFPYASSTTAYPSAICLYGDTVKVTYTPSEARAAEGFIPTTKSVTMTSSSSSFSQSIPSGIAFTVTAPAGSTITAGQQSAYYTFNFYTPDSIVTNEDGTITASYSVASGLSNVFLRVQHPDGVTYWKYYTSAMRTATDAVVTEADLYIGDSTANANSIWRYDYNTRDRADIYMNINGQGYMDMSAGQTYELNMFRNWMSISSDTGNLGVGLPDTHYTVIDVNGQPSDVVTITPNA
ncbi:MAG: cadherin-like beta sandwich domain-containing protein, partial [Lachnospiraceae bacterium]|nr:cadherin-like beta sandwich domain-containing protein [Lachnospiraceae bacterium]